MTKLDIQLDYTVTVVKALKDGEQPRVIVSAVVKGSNDDADVVAEDILDRLEGISFIPESVQVH